MRRLLTCIVLMLGCGCSASHTDDAGIVADADDDAGDDARVVDAALDAGRDAGLDASTDAGESDGGSDACVSTCGIRTCGGDGCGGLCGRPSCAPGVESFEALVPDVIRDFYGNVPTPFTFASGIALTQPVPNEYGGNSVAIVECADRGGFFGFGCADSSGDIPEGSAFLGSAYAFSYRIELTLPELASTVTLRAASTSGTPDTEMTMEAYDLDDHVIDTSVVPNLPVDEWSMNRLTVTTATPTIHRVVLHTNGGAWGFDLLEWE